MPVSRTVTTAALASVAIVVSIALGGCGASSQSSTAENEVTYGAQEVPPDWVLQGKDWGEPYGLDVEPKTFPSGSEALQALLSGEVTISNAGSGRLITTASQQADRIVILGNWEHGGGRYSLIRRPGSDIDTAADLKGATVASDTGSGSHTLFLKWLGQNNVDASDVEIIETKVTDVGAALESGSADIGVVWEPTASLLVHKGVGERMTTIDSVGESVNALVADREWAESHRDEVVRFLAAVIDIGEAVRTRPKSAGSLASEVRAEEGVRTPTAALADAFSRIEMKPEITEEQIAELDELAEDMESQKVIPEAPDMGEIVDDSYLKEARQEAAK